MSQPWFTILPVLNFLDLAPKESYQVARFEKNTQYSVIRMEKDLFEDWTITLVSGRIKSKSGQNRTLAFCSFSETWAQFCDLAMVRYQQGYHLKTINSEAPLYLHFLCFLLSCERDATVESVVKTEKPLRNTTTRPPAIRKKNLPQPVYQQMGFAFC